MTPLSGRQPQAIRSALAVLRAVAQAGPGVTAGEISAELGLPPATTYRILNLLVAEEYIVRLGDLRGFALGTRVAELVGFAIGGPPGSGIEAAIGALRATIGLPVTVAHYTNAGLEIASADPRQPIPVGDLAAANLHASALGRLLLAATPAWRELLPRRVLHRLTPKTITDPRRIDAELGSIQRNGFAVQLEELHPRLGCVAVPVNDAAGRLRASLAVSAHCDVITQRLPELARRLRTTAADLNPLLTTMRTTEVSP